MDIVTLLLAKKYADQLVRGKGAIAGKSAYEIAQENGYTGTVTEWLQSLKGEPGPAGSAAPAIEHKKGDYDIEKITVNDDNGNPILKEDGQPINVLEYMNQFISRNSNEIREPKQIMTTDGDAVLSPNTFYKWDNAITLNITLEKPDSDTILQKYHFMFNSGTKPTKLTLPSDVKTPQDFIIEANKIYDISIVENCLSYQVWNNI